MVEYLNKDIRLPRVFASVAAMTLLVAFVSLVVVWAVFAYQGTIGQLNDPNQQQHLYQALHDRMSTINSEWGEQIFPTDASQSVIYQELIPYVEQQAKTTVHQLPAFLTETVIILFVVLFLLIEGNMLIRRTAGIFGPSTGPNSRAAVKALQEMAKQVRAYIVYRTIINACLALTLGLIFQYVLRLNQPWTWAILAGILNYIPYVGPLIAGIPAALDAFVFQGIWESLIVVLIYIFAQTVDGYIIFPLVLGRQMEMNASTVMVACVFWTFVWGPIGLFLALPLMAAIKAICQVVPGWEPWANLMGMERRKAEPPSWLMRAGWALVKPLAVLGVWILSPLTGIHGPRWSPRPQFAPATQSNTQPTPVYASQTSWLTRIGRWLMWPFLQIGRLFGYKQIQPPEVLHSPYYENPPHTNGVSPESIGTVSEPHTYSSQEHR